MASFSDSNFDFEMCVFVICIWESSENMPRNGLEICVLM